MLEKNRPITICKGFFLPPLTPSAFFPCYSFPFHSISTHISTACKKFRHNSKDGKTGFSRYLSDVEAAVVSFLSLSNVRNTRPQERLCSVVSSCVVLGFSHPPVAWKGAQLDWFTLCPVKLQMQPLLFSLSCKKRSHLYPVEYNFVRAVKQVGTQLLPTELPVPSLSCILLIFILLGNEIINMQTYSVYNPRVITVITNDTMPFLIAWPRFVVDCAGGPSVQQPYLSWKRKAKRL